MHTEIIKNQAKNAPFIKLSFSLAAVFLLAAVFYIGNPFTGHAISEINTPIPLGPTTFGVMALVFIGIAYFFIKSEHLSSIYNKS